jgi:hypothetical protein
MATSSSSPAYRLNQLLSLKPPKEPNRSGTVWSFNARELAAELSSLPLTYKRMKANADDAPRRVAKQHPRTTSGLPGSAEDLGSPASATPVSRVRRDLLVIIMVGG